MVRPSLLRAAREILRKRSDLCEWQRMDLNGDILITEKAIIPGPIRLNTSFGARRI